MAIREQITQIIRNAWDIAERNNLLPVVERIDFSIERPQSPEHGDFASNVAMRLARPMRKDPMGIAKLLVSQIILAGGVERAWVASPGFINFSLSSAWLLHQVDKIRHVGDKYGNVNVGEGQTVQVEFVSVNPTGPLHV